MANLWRRFPSGRLSAADLAFSPIARGFWEIPLSQYYGILKRWTGSAWVKAKMKVLVASSWLQKPAKRWDGSVWKEIDVTGV